MRAQRNNKTITVRLETDQRTRLEDLAAALDRSVGYVVRLAVTAYLETQANTILDRTLQTAAQAQARPQNAAAPSQAPTPIRRLKASQPAPVAQDAPAYDPAHPKPTLRPGTPGGKS